MSELWDNLRQKAEAEQRNKNLPQAEGLWRAALLETENFDRVDRRIALTLEGLAESLWHQSKYQEAIGCCQKLLAIYEQLFGEEQYDVGVVSNNLAMLFHVQARLPEAETFYQRALSIKSKHLGADHPDVSKLTSNYASLLIAMGRQEDAERLRSGYTVITAKNWTRSKPEPVRVEGAVPGIDKLAAPKTRKIPQEVVLQVVRHWELLRSIAEKKSAENNYQEAEAVWAATVIYFDPFAKEDPRRIAYALDSLADCLCAQDKPEAAEPFYKRAIEIKANHLGADHVVVVRGTNNLARIYYQMNRFEEAEPLALKCVDSYARLLGTDHPEYASALHNLGTLYHIQTRYKEAEPLYRRALDIRRRTLGPDHRETLGLARSLANLLRSTGRLEEAERVHGAESAVITGTWRALSIPEAEQLFTSE